MSKSDLTQTQIAIYKDHNMIINFFSHSRLALRHSRAIHVTPVQDAKKTNRLKAGAHGDPPLFNLDKYVEAEEEGKLDDYKYKRVRFSRLWESDSLFFDPDQDKYIRLIMTDGRRGIMNKLLDTFCFETKCRVINQMRKKKEKGEPIEDIVLDPTDLFTKAIENCRPQVITQKVKRGGATYQVPYPIDRNMGVWYASRWMNDTLKDRPRPRKKSYSEALAEEVILASKGQGRIVKMRDDVHRLAQANKAYSHYRWG